MEEKKKFISIVTACYNEEENIEQLHLRIKEIFRDLPAYNYEHVFIDNCSKDKTLSILKQIALNDKNVKVIANARNFGAVRSGFYGLIQCKGERICPKLRVLKMTLTCLSMQAIFLKISLDRS